MVVPGVGRIPELLVPHDQVVPAYAIYGLDDEGADHGGGGYVAQFQ